MYSPRILFSLMTTYNSLILWQNLSLAWNSTNSLAWLTRECQELLSHLHLVIILITNTFNSAWLLKCGFWNSYLNACKGITLLSELSSSAQIYRSLLEHDSNTTSFFLKHLWRAYQISDAKYWRWSGSLSYSPWPLFFLIPPPSKPASLYHLMEAEKSNVSLSRKKWKRISNQEGWESEWVWGLCNNTCLQVGQRNLPKVGKTSWLIRVLECWACEWGGEKKR